METLLIGPSVELLVAGLVADALLGDPEYRWHPVRRIGVSITAWENRLRRRGWEGRWGGILLCVLVAGQWLGLSLAALWILGRVHRILAILGHTFLVYSLLALRSLVDHVAAVGRAADVGDLDGARQAVARLVGRDVSGMDAAACRRAAVESLAENFTDGVLSPLFWYVLAGVPGLVLFKVASTLDSMVGYRTPAYLHFGWAGARWDDLMNLAPARLSVLFIAAAAVLEPGCDPRASLRRAWRDHSLVPGPNAGWSEAAVAGALRRRLVGPIYVQGQLVTDLWIGEPSDPPAGEPEDLRRALRLILIASSFAAAAAVAALASVLTKILSGSGVSW
ncbi:MAG: adenosylcobinamide-phosphate synthase CbiB [Bryobacterales bacterium]|nr:adenosylcobinamide-phosphate synthase CbiB [Bryobacteraceae bacterium]MDW8355209.1 adenosylcobinamide-phosphate synthase CbiB [Bryobacterales bacterium]